MASVVNPLTGRQIRVGGATYNRVFGDRGVGVHDRGVSYRIGGARKKKPTKLDVKRGCSQATKKSPGASCLREYEGKWHAGRCQAAKSGQMACRILKSKKPKRAPALKKSPKKSPSRKNSIATKRGVSWITKPFARPLPVATPTAKKSPSREPSDINALLERLKRAQDPIPTSLIRDRLIPGARQGSLVGIIKGDRFFWMRYAQKNIIRFKFPTDAMHEIWKENNGRVARVRYDVYKNVLQVDVLDPEAEMAYLSAIEADYNKPDRPWIRQELDGDELHNSRHHHSPHPHPSLRFWKGAQ